MTGPDPAFITTADWKSLSDLLASLWMILGSALGIGGSILLAHGMIPSLVATRDIPAKLGRKVRVPMYGSAVVFLGLLLVSILTFVGRLDVLNGIYYRGAQ
jgi:hypothetical protein